MYLFPAGDEHMIGIIDYGMGNLGSVENACRFLKREAVIIRSPSEMDQCSSLILPGVGAFGDCMQNLRRSGFAERVADWVAAGKSLLGICLGLQVLFEESEESPGVAGLGILRGRVRRFKLSPDFKVPQIGWNQVRQVKPECPLFAGAADDSHFYFVHSYYVEPDDSAVTAGVTDYGITYTSAVCRGPLMAVQFHPEKSHRVGLKMLDNFCGLNQKETAPSA